jgi:hypothetical protein
MGRPLGTGLTRSSTILSAVVSPPQGKLHGLSRNGLGFGFENLLRQP